MPFRDSLWMPWKPLTAGQKREAFPSEPCEGSRKIPLGVALHTERLTQGRMAGRNGKTEREGYASRRGREPAKAETNWLLVPWGRRLDGALRGAPAEGVGPHAVGPGGRLSPSNTITRFYRNKGFYGNYSVAGGYSTIPFTIATAAGGNGFPFGHDRGRILKASGLPGIHRSSKSLYFLMTLSAKEVTMPCMAKKHPLMNFVRELSILPIVAKVAASSAVFGSKTSPKKRPTRPKNPFGASRPCAPRAF